MNSLFHRSRTRAGVAALSLACAACGTKTAGAPLRFDASLVLGDGPSARRIESYGPPVGKVDALYDFIWGLAEPRN